MKYQIFLFEFLVNVIMTWICMYHWEEQRTLTYENIKAALINTFLTFYTEVLYGQGRSQTVESLCHHIHPQCTLLPSDLRV